ncbi:glycosyltransferase family 4 protein [Tundrisphaera sp. TA3]|uniref:glycosyltransferase family 4 protein n=1 Tax=Tundrisphaera sp. TA3 TaxID=3435775 RepID=UPI003EBDEA53
MKILALSNLYPPDYIGGYEVACKQAVDALRALGHDVRVVTTAPRTPVPHIPHVRRVWQMTDVYNGYLGARNRPVTAYLEQAESSMVNAFNVHALAREIEDFQPDAAYVHNIVAVGGIGVMATLQHMGVPWVWQLGDEIPVTICRIMGQVHKQLCGEFNRQLDGEFQACSRQLVDEVEAGGVRLRDRVEIFPNWVVGEKPPARERYYRPGQTLRIASAGSISSSKGVDLLIEGAALLRELGHDDFQVDIYGKVEDQAFPTMVHRFGLHDHVHFRGFKPQAELQDSYRDYDTFAFPTWQREPFGLVPLEAAWRGCVPLISHTCGISEWLVHGVHCVKIQRSARGVAEALASIMEGRIDLEPIGRRAAAVVERDFHIDALSPRIERALARAAAKPRRGAGTAAEAYRLALLAEKLAKVLIQEAIPA